MNEIVKHILKHPIATGFIVGTTATSIIKVIKAIEKARGKEQAQ